MKKIIIFFYLFFFCTLFSQSEFVFVYFKDKPNADLFFADPQSELSDFSLQRRANLGISLNIQDAPIEKSYLEQIKNLGFNVENYSKWLNGVAIEILPSQIPIISSLPFVKNIEFFAKNNRIISKIPSTNESKWSKFYESTSKIYNYGIGQEQVEQIRLKELHQEGFTGKGIRIAVLDSGFPTVNTGIGYQKLRDENRLKGGYNFIWKNNDVYNPALNPHGAYVLGTMAGNIENSFVGSAPEADYFLFVTEDGSVEIPLEEIFWIMGAEEADRKGVDIINSSLGYTVYDDPKYNYNYSDMDGKTTFIARGAEIASEKGIIVVNSAGNYGNSSWKYIVSPADNSKVFSVGAVASDGSISTFSSFGPNSLGQIKPDVAARGTAAATVYNSTATAASGTSFSAPITSGGIACLLQAIPNYIPREVVLEELRKNASLYPNKNDQIGFGILNFHKTLQYFKDNSHKYLVKEVQIFPIPASDFLFLRSQDKIQLIEIFDPVGRLIKTKIPQFNSISVNDLKSGVYYVKLYTDKNMYFRTMLKK